LGCQIDYSTTASAHSWNDGGKVISELVGSLEIDRELKRGRLHDQQVGRLLAFDSAVEVEAGLAIRFRADIA
jgi:hypothetical protein